MLIAVVMETIAEPCAVRNAAVTKNADGLAGMVLDDLPYAGLNPAAKLCASLAVGKNSLFNVLQPLVRK